MLITAIEPVRGENYRVFVDDEYYCTLNLEIIVKNHLKMGMTIEEELLDSLSFQAEERRAKERAYYLLGYRDHSEQELYDKLLKSVRPEIAAKTVAKMKEQELLNDSEYAAKLARYGLGSKLWGPKKVFADMLKRGIAKETALESIEECSYSAIDNIGKLIEKKYYRTIDGSYSGTQKAVAALLRQGYSISDIKEAIEIYISNQEEE